MLCHSPPRGQAGPLRPRERPHRYSLGPGGRAAGTRIRTRSRGLAAPPQDGLVGQCTRPSSHGSLRPLQPRGPSLHMCPSSPQWSLCPQGSAGAPGPLRDAEHRPRGVDQPARATVGAGHRPKGGHVAGGRWRVLGGGPGGGSSAGRPRAPFVCESISVFVWPRPHLRGLQEGHPSCNSQRQPLIPSPGGPCGDANVMRGTEPAAPI